MVEISYHEYMISEQWRDFREFAYKMLGRQCAKCGGSSHIELHHKTYFRLGHEKVPDVVPMCRVCHNRFHLQFSKTNGLSLKTATNRFLRKKRKKDRPKQVKTRGKRKRAKRRERSRARR